MSQSRTTTLISLICYMLIGSYTKENEACTEQGLKATSSDSSDKNDGGKDEGKTGSDKEAGEGSQSDNPKIKRC